MVSTMGPKSKTVLQESRSGRPLRLLLDGFEQHLVRELSLRVEPSQRGTISVIGTISENDTSTCGIRMRFTDRGENSRDSEVSLRSTSKYVCEGGSCSIAGCCSGILIFRARPLHGGRCVCSQDLALAGFLMSLTRQHSSLRKSLGSKTFSRCTAWNLISARLSSSLETGGESDLGKGSESNSQGYISSSVINCLVGFSTHGLSFTFCVGISSSQEPLKVCRIGSDSCRPKSQLSVGTAALVGPVLSAPIQPFGTLVDAMDLLDLLLSKLPQSAVRIRGNLHSNTSLIL